MNTTQSKNNEPIDAVITWVDGNDPEHLRKMDAFLANPGQEYSHGKKPTRFRSVNEIRYCVFSIFAFAPFVRNVYIVTDKQDPGLDEEIKRYFPERIQTLKVIDHKEIFSGYEEFLPTFNSSSIESMIWRIEELSDRFIYFNDDFFLIRKTEVSDFFLQNSPVLRGVWLPSAWPRKYWASFKSIINRSLFRRKHYQPKPSHHLRQWLASKKAGFRFKYFYFNHTPYSICKQTANTFFKKNPDFFLDQVRFRFRNFKQIHFISLLYHLELKNGNKNLRKPEVVYANPVGRSEGYIDRKIELCKRDETIKFLCVQSMDLCNKADQDRIFNWLDSLFNEALSC